LKIVTSDKYGKITDLSTNQVFTRELSQPSPFGYNDRSQQKNRYSIILKPHSFRAFSFE
jgi:hypothetical protein